MILKDIFPGLSRSWNFQEKKIQYFPGLFRRRGNPVNHNVKHWCRALSKGLFTDFWKQWLKDVNIKNCSAHFNKIKHYLAYPDSLGNVFNKHLLQVALIQHLACKHRRRYVQTHKLQEMSPIYNLKTCSGHTKVFMTHQNTTASYCVQLITSVTILSKESEFLFNVISAFGKMPFNYTKTCQMSTK